MDKNDDQKKLVTKRNLTDNEQRSIARLKEKGGVSSQPIFRSRETGDEGTVELIIDETLENKDANDLLDSCIMGATGSSNRQVGLQLLINAVKAISSKQASNKELSNQLNTLTQSMQSFAPQDEYEGQLVAQLIALHEHAMDWLGRAMRTEKVNFANLNGALMLQ